MAVAGADYTLTLDGKNHDIELGTEQTIIQPDGTKLQLKLEKKAFVTFTVSGVSFEHPGNLTVASQEIDPGIMQHLLATATGSLILVQTYDDLDATSLVDLMTGKMTDDDVAAGAKP